MGNNGDKMLENASKRLGITPDRLKAAIAKGSLDDALSGMKKEDAAKLKAVINNPEVVSKLMKSKEASELLKNMGK